MTSGGQSIEFSFNATDDISGLRAVYLQLYGGFDEAFAARVAVDGTCFGCVSAYLTSGTLQDGTWTATIDIPAGTAAQTVAVYQSGQLLDLAGNYGEESDESTLATFSIVGTTDTVAPVLGTAWVSADNVDVRNGSQTIDFSFTASDDISGLAAVFFSLHGDGGWGESVGLEGNCFGCTYAYLSSGTTQDGTWTASIEVPAGLGSQTVVVTQTNQMLDAAGNYGEVTESTLTTFTITGTPDTVPPVLGTVWVSQDGVVIDNVDITNGGQTIDFSFTATDDKSGLRAVYLRLYGRFDEAFAASVAIEGTSIGPAPAYLTSGTLQDGTWTASIYIPAGHRTQTVAIYQSGQMLDLAGNYGEVSDESTLATFTITNSGG